MTFFSIITPCYNSSKTLLKTYESLCRQDGTDFEWILVDDASTDNGETRNLIELIASKAKFPVKALYLLDNYFGSKSVFEGCALASGKYVAILDHDDCLTSDALVKVRNHINNYESEKNFVGVCGRCVDEGGALIGKKFNKDHILANESVIRFKYRIVAELFQFTKREVIEQFFEEMKPGYTNGYVWARIAQNFNYLYVNDVLRIYDTSLPTSYSNTKSHLIKFPAAKADALKTTIISYRYSLIHNPLYSLKIIASYMRHTILARRPLSIAVADFDFVLKMWCFILYPISFMKAIFSLRYQ